MGEDPFNQIRRRREDTVLPNLFPGLRKLVEQTPPHQVIVKLGSAAGLADDEIVQLLSPLTLTAALAKIRGIWGERPAQPFDSWTALVASSLSRSVGDCIHESNRRIRRRLGTVLTQAAAETELSVFFESQESEDLKTLVSSRAKEICCWCFELDDYPAIARLQDDPKDNDAWTELLARKDTGLKAWFATSPGIRHPQSHAYVKGPTEGSQRASVQHSAEDLAQETWAYLASGVIPGKKSRLEPVPKILLFSPARGSFRHFLQYYGSVVLLRFYAARWPIWAVVVALMDLLPRFEGLDGEAEVLAHVSTAPELESDDATTPSSILLKPVHDRVTRHFEVAYGLGHPAHEVLSWVLVDTLRRPPRKIVTGDVTVRFGAYAVRLSGEFFDHFQKGSKADPQLVGSWWQPMQDLMTRVPNQTLIGNAKNPAKLPANLAAWAHKVRQQVVDKAGIERPLFDAIREIAKD